MHSRGGLAVLPGQAVCRRVVKLHWAWDRVGCFVSDVHVEVWPDGSHAWSSLTVILYFQFLPGGQSLLSFELSSI